MASSAALTHSLRPMPGDFFAQEGDAFAELVHAVFAVFDTDPAVETDGGQFRKYRVVIV